MFKLTLDKLTPQKLPLFLIILFLMFIPILIYLISVRFQAQDLLNITKLLNQNSSSDTGPNLNSLDQLRQNLEQKFAGNNKPAQTSTGNFTGPSLHFNLKIEGRSADQSTKLFVGIAAGGATTNPTYILSFLTNVPSSGEFSNISLSGIDIGQPYTAYLKGASQITKAVPFTSQPLINDLGLVELTSGDLNDDNQISSADLTIERNLIGQTPKTANWNQYADFNQDLVINNIDLTYVQKNQNAVGDGGPWVSSPIKNAQTLGVATVSGQPSEASSSGGYWLWIPQF